MEHNILLQIVGSWKSTSDIKCHANKHDILHSLKQRGVIQSRHVRTSPRGPYRVEWKY